MRQESYAFRLLGSKVHRSITVCTRDKKERRKGNAMNQYTALEIR